jgi:DEAD/DEAH box helicase domain-containing protein
MGDQYIVKSLDLENRRCYVEETGGNYYTDSIVKSDIKVLHKDREELSADMKVAIGDILVRSQVAQFKKLKYKTHENVGYGDVSLPEEEMHTRSVVLILDRNMPAGRSFEDFDEEMKAAVIRGLGYLIRHVSPVFLLCDPRDLGISERLKDPFFGQSCLYVYDNYPGGSGLSEGFLQKSRAILKGCLEVVAGCACRAGCPSCIGPPEKTEARRKNHKSAVLRFLSSLRGLDEG